MKKELYEYAISKDTKANSLAKKDISLMVAFVSIFNTIIILLLVRSSWLIGLLFFSFLLICSISTLREKDSYSQRLLLVFTWLFFMMAPAAFLVRSIYRLPVFTTVISLLSWILLYEISFSIKIFCKKHILKNNTSRRRKAIFVLSPLASFFLGSFLGKLFRGTKWFAFAFVIFSTFLATVAISYLQKYFIYHVWNTGRNTEGRFSCVNETED